MKYRPEIDGLRALAVIPVILFHAGFGLFSGGFIGVDVFFVISGYLITTILVADIENNRFDLLNFYDRRARRILPALFFVMLLCVPVAWVLMLPEPLENFGQSVVSTVLFSNNILLWLTSGYWDLLSEFKPLLHTWSLAVEEQFYIVFPVLLFFAWRFGVRFVVVAIGVIALTSLLLSEMIWRNIDTLKSFGWENASAGSFYLAPTRAWELLAGAIAAFHIRKQGVKSVNTLSLLGLMAILFSVMVYDRATPFPGIYGLLPVLGTVLLVLYGGKDTVVAKILSTKIFVGLGLISYSAYLWHQPLFAFARTYSVTEPSTLTYSIVILLSIGMAYVSWRYIEIPFRGKAKVGGRIFML